MRYIVTTNRHIQLIEDNDNGKILDSKGFQFGQLYYRIVKGKVTFYHFDQEHPWRNDVWSADIPLQINGELYENEEEVGNKLYEVMEDSLFDKIEDLIKEDSRLDQKIGDEIDRAKEEEVKLSDKVDGLEDEIDAIDHKVDGYDEKIKATEDKVNGLDDKLEKEILRSSEKDAEHDAFVSNFSSNLEEEVERAKAAESALTQALNSEISRAISAETEIANDLDAEVTRATNIENEIENKLNSEITRSTEKDAIHDEKLANLDTSLHNEIKRATEAENSLRSDLNSEVSRATDEEDRIDAKLDKEIADRIADVDAEEARALSAETRLESKIDAEVTRSTNKDTEHDEKIASLEQADENITNALNSEIQRALSAETSLRTDLNGEITRANGEETRIEGLLANEINRSSKKDTEHDDKIANLEDELSEEISRAKSEEKRVDDKLDKEIADRTSDVNAEEARAMAAEKAIDDKLNKEITRSTEKDASHDSLINGLTTSLQNEVTRAQGAESALTNSLNNEIARATSAETVLHDEILSERDRALEAESGITANLNAEIARATARENAIDAKLDNEIARATKSEDALNDKIDNEITRSTAKDASNDSLISGLTTSLQSEINRATNAENSLRNDLNSEISERTNSDAEQLQRITELEVGKADANSVYTKTESDAKYTTKDYTTGITEAFFDAAAYDSKTKKINFYHGNTIKAQIDASSFIKDGMVDNVAISGSNLVITFNTESGKEPISIPLSSIFDPSNYFTKSEIDSALSGKVDNSTFNTLSGRVDTISGDVITVSGRVDTISGTVQTVKQEIITISGDSVTSGEVQTMINKSISGKADSDDVYTKNEVYTKSEVDEAIADIDLSNFYTKSEVDASQLAQDNKINAISGDVKTLNEKVDTISGSAITSGEVQTQIDNSISGKADKKDIYTYVGSDRIKVSTAAGVGRKAIDLNLPIYSGSGMESLSLGSPIGTGQGSNQIKGGFSTGIGIGLTTNNATEFATGQYNISNTVGGVSWGNSGNTLFSVGNGNYQGGEHNAFEVRQNGDIYITSGGTSTSSMIKLQDALATAGGSGITSGQVQTMIDESTSGKTNQSDFTAHTANTTVHVTASEKSTWNAKSDFSGDYNDLTNKPTIPNYTAGSGITISNNVISVTGGSELVDAYTKAESDAKFATITNFNTHSGNTSIHVTASEKSTWNAKPNVWCGDETAWSQISGSTESGTIYLVY